MEVGEARSASIDKVVCSNAVEVIHLCFQSYEDLCGCSRCDVWDGAARPTNLEDMLVIRKGALVLWGGVD